MTFVLFIFGACIGSFLNVVIVRYDPDRSLFRLKRLQGRSHCLHCKRQLTWFELIPIVSFLLQRGRCWGCHTRISLQYPIVELLSGLLFVFVPQQLPFYIYQSSTNVLSVLWVLVFLTLLVISVIDFRERIIPDEANVLLVILGICITYFSRPTFGLATGSFLKSYALLFGFRENIWINHGVAMLAAALFFGVLILVTLGRGMGMGDLKLAIAMGVVFGWPDTLLAIGLAFVIGALVSLWLLCKNRKTMKSFVPFGPFLALGCTLVFFFGYQLLAGYFALFSF